MQKQTSKILDSDFPEETNIGNSKYKHVSRGTARRDVTVDNQRIIRLGIKNARRRENGLPALTSYALV